MSLLLETPFDFYDNFYFQEILKSVKIDYQNIKNNLQYFYLTENNTVLVLVMKKENEYLEKYAYKKTFSQKVVDKQKYYIHLEC